MNKDYNLRERILFHEDFNADEHAAQNAFRNAKSFSDFEELTCKFYQGGCRHFRGINLETIKELVKNDFLDLEERQNESPSTKEFIEVAEGILEKDPEAKVLFEGYAVSPNREDYRVTITTIILIPTNVITDAIYEDFLKLVQNADDLDVQPNFVYAWWD